MSKVHHVIVDEVIVPHGDSTPGVSWKICSDGSVGGLKAVFGGIGTDGGPLFVGRIKVENSLIPGKVTPVHHRAYASNDDEEIPLTTYEVLHCTKKVSWVLAQDGKVPYNALITGNACNGDPLYTCRAVHCNAVIIGKVHPSKNIASIPHNNAEVLVTKYEVLVVS